MVSVVVKLHVRRGGGDCGGGFEFPSAKTARTYVDVDMKEQGTKCNRWEPKHDVFFGEH